MMDKTQKILNTYYNAASPGGFGSVKRLKSVLPNYTHAQIENTLLSQPTHTKYKPVKHSFVRRKYNIHTANYLWQIDLLVIPKYGKSNRNYKYILMCIDCFTKRGFAAQLKTKGAQEVLQGFIQILEQARAKPVFVQSDLGTEFVNKRFETFLSDNKIKLFSVHSDKKACIVERWNRTIMLRISKWFEYSKKHNWIDHIQDFIDSYNNSYHRTIGCAPNQVNKYNEMDVWLHTNKELYTTNLYKKKSKLKKGDSVRIKTQKGVFDKGYSSTFTTSVFEVSEVLNTRPTTYKLQDSDGDTLKGIFYYEELSKVL